MAAENFTYEDLKKRLYEERYTVRSWAIRHKYNVHTTYKTLKRMFEHGKPPRYGVGRQIVSDIGQTIKIDLID